MSGVWNAKPVALLLMAGCAGHTLAQDISPISPVNEGPAVSAADDPPSSRTYENACATCHDNGGFGVQVIADRSGAERALIHEGTNLPAAAIRAIVRNGFGAMPAMSKVEVSDAELDAIIADLTAAGGGQEP